MNGDTPLVEMRDIIKRFGTIEVLRGVEVRVDHQ